MRLLNYGLSHTENVDFHPAQLVIGGETITAASKFISWTDESTLENIDGVPYLSQISGDVSGSA